MKTDIKLNKVLKLIPILSCFSHQDDFSNIKNVLKLSKHPELTIPCLNPGVYEPCSV